MRLAASRKGRAVQGWPGDTAVGAELGAGAEGSSRPAHTLRGNVQSGTVVVLPTVARDLSPLGYVRKVDKLEQVFVSSTYLDLLPARQAVIKTLLEADCIPAGMELFPASDDDRWTLIKRVIDNSDYYIVIVGGRYGSVDEDTGLSYTEMEFDYAVATGTPVMGFIHGAPEDIPAKHVERDEAAAEHLAKFKQKVQQKMCKFWTTPDNLAGDVALSLIQIRKTHPAVGWVRGDRAMTADTRAEMAELRERVVELEQELAGAATVSAEDPSGLAQGADAIALQCSYDYWDGRGRRSSEWEVTTTWDSIFKEIAPVLMDEGSEPQIRKALVGHAIPLFVDQCELPKKAEHASFEVRASSVADVVVQLYALGLIQRGTKKRTVKDVATYWKLTKRGEDHLMKLRARRRPEIAAE